MLFLFCCADQEPEKPAAVSELFFVSPTAAPPPRYSQLICTLALCDASTTNKSNTTVSTLLATFSSRLMQTYLHTSLLPSSSVIGSLSSASSFTCSQLTRYPSAHDASTPNKIKKVSPPASVDPVLKPAAMMYVYSPLPLHT